MTNRTLRWLCGVLAVVVLIPVDAVQSQPSARRLGPIRVTLVSGTSLRKGGRVEVVRRAQQGPRNLILLAPDATPEDLAAAMSLMSALRLQFGDSPATDLRAVPRITKPGTSFAGSPYSEWLADQLTRLRNAAASNVNGIGIGRAVQITIPAPRGVFRPNAVPPSQ